jgi:hypothetical protein
MRHVQASEGGVQLGTLDTTLSAMWYQLGGTSKDRPRTYTCSNPFSDTVITQIRSVNHLTRGKHFVHSLFAAKDVGAALLEPSNSQLTCSIR